MIPRRHIPALPVGVARIGTEGLVRRSFDVQNENPIRLYREETLELTIEFQSYPEDAQVHCYTNFNQPNRSWIDLPLRKGDDDVFFLSQRARICGVFAFRMKYSFDGGKTWIWDRSPLMHVHVDPPRMRDIRNYTLIPTVLGTTEQWTDHLSHVKAMGFNMVHLLPVTAMGASESPYSAADLFQLDESFYKDNQHQSATDGLAAFEAFVDAAKEANISLCIDLVLNHVAPDSALAQVAPDWIMPDKKEEDGLQRSGCWHMDEWLKWKDLVKIYYDHPNAEKKEAIWEYMRDYALFWANYANETNGMVRLDNLHNSDEDFISYILDCLRSEYPELIIHAEFFSDSNTLLKRAELWDLNLFLANSWEYPYAENLRDYIKHCHDIGNRLHQYMPVTTHDTGVPADLFGDANAVVPRYFITALFSTGQTGVVQGVEYAVTHKIEFIGRKQAFPHQKDAFIMDHITRINGVLADHDCLHQVGNLKFVDGNHGAIIGGFRAARDEAFAGLLLLANLDTQHSHTVKINLSQITGHQINLLHDVFHDSGPLKANSVLDVELTPCGVAAWRLLGKE
ncbi:MAG: hypothetical protein JXR76_20770 [Deltaproteobacteria bacterium]|nr:hypothetical protein [Deltaproteobacteria bacterium]